MNLEEDLNRLSLDYPKLAKFLIDFIEGKLARCEICKRLDKLEYKSDDLKLCWACHERAVKNCD